MKTRKRFHGSMSFGKVDRPPLFDEGMRSDVLAGWRAQGLVGEASLASRFLYDRRISLDADLDPPRRLRGRPDLTAYRRRLDSGDPARMPKPWTDACTLDREDVVLGLTVSDGLFQNLGVGDGATFEELVYLWSDDPACVHEALEIHAAFSAELIDRILEHTEVDYALFSEPIGSTHGPLIAPRQYRDTVLAAYRPLFDVLRKHQIDSVIFATYANARSLLDDVLDAGCNTLWSMESESTEMDYLDLRRVYGRDLRLIGGIDLDVLTHGQEAIRREVLTRVPVLCAQGGYIPLADGRVRATVSFEDYRYYRNLLEETVVAAISS